MTVQQGVEGAWPESLVKLLRVVAEDKLVVVLAILGSW